MTPRGWAEPQLEISIAEDPIKLGSRFHLHLKISWLREEGSYKFAVPVPATRNLVLRRQGESQESFKRNGQTWESKTFTLEFQPEQGGAAWIEPFVVHYVGPELLKSGQFQIEGKELKIFEPKRRNMRFWGWIYALAAALLALRLYAWIRKKKESPADREAGRTLEDRMIGEIRERLNQRSAQPFQDMPSFLEKRFAAYLKERYKLPGSVSPAPSSILQALPQDEISAKDLSFLRDVFQELNAVKYSGADFTEQDALGLAAKITRYIEGKRVVTGGSW